MKVSKIFKGVIFIIILVLLLNFGLKLVSDANTINNILGILLLTFTICLPSIITLTKDKIKNIFNKK